MKMVLVMRELVGTRMTLAFRFQERYCQAEKERKEKERKEKKRKEKKRKEKKRKEKRDNGF